MYKQNKQKGITLIALVITIIILLILAGISISALTGNGLFARANDAKIESKIGEIEEFATLEVYRLYTENINNLDAVNDATIRSVLEEKLVDKVDDIESVPTTSAEVTKLIIKDKNDNSCDSISLEQQKNTTIKVELDTANQLVSYKTYIKIYDYWYELIIKDKTVKVSREKHEEPVNNGNTYKIKITPPSTSSGIIMKEGETKITSETTITPGESITVQAGNDIGTFSFTVEETTSSVKRTVNIIVTAGANIENVGDIVNNESKVGYYTDMDLDGYVDGIIYADLYHGKNGNWLNNENYSYSIPTMQDEEFEGYEIVESRDENDYDVFKTGKPVIGLNEFSTGGGRFYVMALNDLWRS